jgi:cytochrome c oxidase subunit III
MSSTTYKRPAPAVRKIEPSQTGIWVAICAIAMTFAALTSALVVRQGASLDWQAFVLPRILYLNTAILLASSFTLEISRKRLDSAGVAAGDAANSFYDATRYWLYVTLALGLIFLLGQVLAWRILAGQGLFLATNPSSSFFYVLTALHGLHVLGGIAGLLYAGVRVSRAAAAAKSRALSAAAVYWHFMDILWVYLLFIIAVRM